MTITLIDAFGTIVGAGEVTWTAQLDLEELARIVAEIFPPVTSVVLPTRYEHVPWRLEIKP
jgi:hypothetical protein